MKNKGIGLKGIFSILAVLLLFGAADAGSTIYQNNVKTAQHVFAPGAKVAIIPPSGSRVSQKIVGFDLASGGGTISFTERAGSYADNVGSYTKDSFGSRDNMVIAPLALTVLVWVWLSTCRSTWSSLSCDAHT